MIPITLNGAPYKLVFKHHRYGDNPMVFSPTVLISDRTEAIIYDATNQPILKGIAFCNVVDRFEKEKGRRLALQKALSKMERGERKKVFEQYDGRRRG